MTTTVTITRAPRAKTLLIAAAPELLAALQTAMFFVPIKTKARMMGDLAIDKAKGYEKAEGKA